VWSFPHFCTTYAPALAVPHLPFYRILLMDHGGASLALRCHTLNHFRAPFFHFPNSPYLMATYPFHYDTTFIFFYLVCTFPSNLLATTNTFYI